MNLWEMRKGIEEVKEVKSWIWYIYFKAMDKPGSKKTLKKFII